MPKKVFNELAYKNLSDFIFGSSIHPVKCKNGLVIGGGKVFPELNFTLPPMSITKETMPEVLKQYKSIMEDACKGHGAIFTRFCSRGRAPSANHLPS